MKKMRKAVSTMVALAMTAGLLLPATAPAFAATDNRVSKVMNVDDEYDNRVGQLTIQEDSDFPTDFATGETFSVVLPSGVNWNTDGAPNENVALSYDANLAAPGGVVPMVAGTDYTVSSDQILDVTIPAGLAAATQGAIYIDLGIEIDGAEGDIKVNVDPIDSGVTGGEYLIARVLAGDTTTKAMSVETIGEAGNGGDLRIEENAVGAVGNAAQTIELRLPNDFNWNVAENAAPAIDPDAIVHFSGGFAGLQLSDAAGMPADGRYDVVANGDTLTIEFDPLANRTQRGIITVDTPLDADSDADYGDIEVNVSGTEVDDADVVIAKYADFGAEVTVDSVEELKAGKFGEDVDTITIEETVPGTFIAGRDINVKFPSWVKVTDVAANASGGGLQINAPTVNNAGTGDIDGDGNDFDVRIQTASSNGTGKIELDVEVSIEGNKSGDIEAVVSSKNGGVAETKLVVAKAIPVATASIASAKEVKIGVQGQAVNDVTVGEGIDEVFVQNGTLTMELPSGVSFASKPKFEVVEGNLELDQDSVALVAVGDEKDRIISVNVDSESSKVSKIKISDIKLNINRIVPEGDLVAKIGGTALIENSKSALGWVNGVAMNPAGNTTTLDAGEFDTGTAAKVVLAKVVTPAPEAGTVQFNIGSTVYTAGGVTKVMDAAPYIKAGRTYVPVRYLALALGVSEDNIKFENGVVTLVKGDTTLKLTIGSQTLANNDATSTMDVAPEVVDGRTMLPARYVAEGFGALVGYANGQVVISY